MSALPTTDVQRKRPPVAIVMGHVDHGKTTLLDTIRKKYGTEDEENISEVAGQESGGITQHIDAYEVHVPVSGEEKQEGEDTQRITFIDTPGHEAFSVMRRRGTRVADVAVLVVAADDGVNMQTKEVIKHIQEAELPFIVAVNKIDKPDADPERIKNELAQEGVLVEGRGGKIPILEISAKEGTGIEGLIEMITLVTDLEDLSYNPVESAEGYVVESFRDARRGLTTTIVLTNGTLRVGDLLVCGSALGKIKIMENTDRERVKGAVPSSPVLVVGLDELTVSGDLCHVVETEREGHERIEKNQKETQERLAAFKLNSEGKDEILNLIVKADVQGSLEAVIDSLRQVESERVGIKVLSCECGEVSEGDTKLADASGAHIVAFRVGVSKEADHYTKQKGVIIHSFNIIYELMETVREIMQGLVKPEIEVREIGALRVLKVFRTESSRMIVGGKVTKGSVKKGARAEVVRDGETVGEGTVSQLKHGEEARDEIDKGKEAGIMFSGKTKIQEGDTLAIFEEVEVHPEL